MITLVKIAVFNMESQHLAEALMIFILGIYTKSNLLVITSDITFDYLFIIRLLNTNSEFLICCRPLLSHHVSSSR